MKTLYIMKNRLIAIALLMATIGVTAQIDRSKQPEPGPSPTINLNVPEEFELNNGMKVLVVINRKLPRASFTLRIDNPPIVEGEKAGVASLLGSMLGNGTSTIPKDAFNEEIDFLGAQLGFGPQSAYASSLSKYSDRILELMADAAMNPLLTEEEFQKEKDKLIENLKAGDKSVDQVAGRVGGALSYGTHHPRGEFITEATINNVTLDNVRSFYQEYFNPNKAYLVVIGDVDYMNVERQVTKLFGKWKKSIEISESVPTPNPNAQYTQINFVDMPNAVQSNISITNNVDLKMKDVDYHSVLIANKILGGGFSSYLNMNLREEHGYTYGARSSVGTSRYNASRFTAGAAVRNAVTDSAVVEALKEIKRIKTEDVSFKDLRNAKAKYLGDFVLALERPQTVANYALNIKLNDLPNDFYTTYLAKINAVTKEDVKRVANKYFKTENAKVIVVGKGSDVLENLEKTGIPIMYFDTYAGPTDKPVFSKPIPSGVTAESVMNDYIKAVGGKDNVAKVNTVLTLADVTIEGAPFKPKATIKAMSPNKVSMEMTIEGMGTIMKRKFDGASGYQEAQGQKIPMTDKEVNDQKAEKGLFPELFMDASNIELEILTVIEGVDVYKIKVTKGDDVSYRFYNAANGLLMRTEKTVEAQGQSMTSIEDVSDYKEVNGVMFPHTTKVTAGPQVIILSTTSVKINEGVTEADFN